MIVGERDNTQQSIWSGFWFWLLKSTPYTPPWVLPSLQQMQMLDSFPQNWHARPPWSNLPLGLSVFQLLFLPLLAFFCWLSLPLSSEEWFPLQQEAKCPYFELLAHFSSVCWTTRIPSKMSLLHTNEACFSWLVPGLFFSLSDGINTCSSRHALLLLFGRFRRSCLWCSVMFLLLTISLFSSISVNFLINWSCKFFVLMPHRNYSLVCWRRCTRYLSPSFPSFGAICLNTLHSNGMFSSAWKWWSNFQMHTVYRSWLLLAGSGSAKSSKIPWTVKA